MRNITQDYIVQTVTSNHCPNSRTMAGLGSGQGCSVLSCHFLRCSLYCWIAIGSFLSPRLHDPRNLRHRVSRICVCCWFYLTIPSEIDPICVADDLRSSASSASLKTRWEVPDPFPCRSPANFPSARFHLQFSMLIFVCCGTEVSSRPPGRNCHFLAPQTPLRSAWLRTNPWRPCRR